MRPKKGKTFILTGFFKFFIHHSLYMFYRNFIKRCIDEIYIKKLQKHKYFFTIQTLNKREIKWSETHKK